MYTIMNSPIADRGRQAAGRSVWLALLFAMLVLVAHAGPAKAEAVPGMLSSHAQTWHKLGEGELRWFGLRIYRAALWSAEPAWDPDQPFALAIRYDRSIRSGRLVDTSLDEMRRLAVADDARIEAWRGALEQAFPDVESGEVIVGVRHSGGGASFYHKDRLTARIEDAAFADAFFAIWLDERTREPSLRERLLGGPDNG